MVGVVHEQDGRVHFLALSHHDAARQGVFLRPRRMADMTMVANDGAAVFIAGEEPGACHIVPEDRLVLL